MNESTLEGKIFQKMLLDILFLAVESTDTAILTRKTYSFVICNSQHITKILALLSIPLVPCSFRAFTRAKAAYSSSAEVNSQLPPSSTLLRVLNLEARLRAISFCGSQLLRLQNRKRKQRSLTLTERFTRLLPPYGKSLPLRIRPPEIL